MADAERPYGEPGAPLSRHSPFYRGVLGGLGLLTAFVLGLAVREAASVLVLILIAAFLAIGLDPVVTLAMRRGMSRGLAVLVIAIGFLAVMAVLVVVIGGTLVDQISSFIDNAPHLIDDLRRNRTVRHLDKKFHIFSALETKLQSPDIASTAAGGIFDIGLTVLTAVANTVIVFVLTVYFLGALPTIKKAVYSLAPADRRDRVHALGDEILRRVGGYAIGAVLVALTAGVVTAILLVCVGLSEYALVLGVLVALLDLVPLVGALIGAASVCLVGLATSVPVGIACVVFYVIYEAFEGYVLYPRVMRSTVDVPEYVTIVAVLVGGAVGGIVGALLALPVAAATVLLVREVWVRRQDAA